MSKEDGPFETVEVEIRLFRADEERYGTRLTPMRMSGRLTDAEREPVLVVEHPDGDRTAYTAAQAQEDAGVLIVRETPTADQLELLRRAAAGGFAIEPYVAGDAWREIEEL
jgi:hypothetical protein